ncbi:MAG: ABC transporter permease subunit [Acidobacteria bacterium]|nr:ABC transporter permease subunit [Acidobacteriota bacterium]NIM60100.1 ABC transporter permease subunit [Acidobacteriota bacterium]NIO59458.1 ABC transporter permease subunit [Acidobacteriota bacterium]NIQ30489.1 ABC transporter permease subunit [Acidobacteriota bacterium]NIQ85428.1 ABC transporter permease subunit [Acidobacteriota bacterium]
MLRRIVSRLATGALTLLLVTLLVFGLIQLAPGDPMAVQDDGMERLSAADRAALEAYYGFDRPVAVQYASWLGRLLRGDLGNSIRDRRPVAEKIGERLSVTLSLNAMALFLIVTLSVPIGAAAALNPGSVADRWSATATYLLYAVPIFWAALLLQRLFAVRLGWLPLYGSGGVTGIPRVANMVLPVICLTYGGLAYVSRFVRANLLESTRFETILSARARGMTRFAILVRHGFRLAAVPMLTLAGFLIPALFAGSVIVETVFQLPGLGWLFIDAAYQRDLPVLLGVTLISGAAALAGILFADVTYALADPRVRRG